MIDIEGRDPRTRFWVQSTKSELEGKLGSTFSLSNGLLGLRGAHEECPPWGRPEFYVAGTYAGGPPELLGFHDPDHILTHPERTTPEALAAVETSAIWTLPNLPFPIAVKLVVGDIPFDHDTSKILTNERMVEVDNAVMRRCLVFRDDAGRRTRVDSCRFVSFADHNLVCLRYRVTPLEHRSTVAVEGVLDAEVANTNGVVLWQADQIVDTPEQKAIECITAVSRLRVSIAQTQSLVEQGGVTYLDLFAIAGQMPLEQAMRRAEAARKKGYDSCVSEHRRAYHIEQQCGHVEFDGNAATVQGFNFGQMHMHMALGPIAEKTGIPIKGLTGHGYRFCNFWDMDFHMFPYYLMTKPVQAKKLLEYRYGQLDVYRANARHWGARGAQVPWETNTRGEEETAPWLCLQEREIHISADAARMFRMYADITGDDSVMVDMGAEFILETARFYASRIKWIKERKRYELPDIGCPDQYHTFADNNIFISLWARWNLQEAVKVFDEPAYAAAVAKTKVTEDDVEFWQDMAAKLFIHEPNADGIVEEFDGFFDLDPDMNGISETYCRHSQAVKQPDVLAATVAFEDLFSEDIRRKNWHFYNARTLHGSSLSLPGMAYSAARCRLNDEALYNLHKSSRMDLDDVNLDTERGIHVSGGAVQWYAVVFGFGGLTPTAGELRFRPNLPRQWSHLNFTVHWRFQRLRVRLTQTDITFDSTAKNRDAIRVRIGNGPPIKLQPGAIYTVELT